MEKSSTSKNLIVRFVWGCLLQAIVTNSYIRVSDPVEETDSSTVSSELDIASNKEAIEYKTVRDEVSNKLLFVQQICHGIAKESGWWEPDQDLLHAADAVEAILKNTSTQDSILSLQRLVNVLRDKAHGRNVGELLCLVHSEISEAMEGDRKDKMDDKLPHRKMIEVELADAIIRIFDMAEAMQLDVPGAVAEKLHFNCHREDHKLENRMKEGGKKY